MAVTPLHEERTREEYMPTPGRTAAIPLLSLALQILDERVLLWAVVLGAGGVWTFTLMHPEPLRLIAASLFSVLIFLPILWKQGRS